MRAGVWALAIGAFLMVLGYAGRHSNAKVEQLPRSARSWDPKITLEEWKRQNNAVCVAAWWGGGIIILGGIALALVDVLFVG